MSENKKSLRSVLIANRGEIVLRIVRTLRSMDIQSASIFSIPDKDLPHAFAADVNIPIGGESAQDSYLSFEKILEAVQKHNIDSVHPGFGFLSESAEFAEFIRSHNLSFIGPSTQSIRSMGSKIEAKKLAKSAGVNIIPGNLEPLTTIEEAIKIAEDIGYPIILKASFGGGGKGMRVIRNARELIDNFEITKSEAKNSFKNDEIFIEKYIENPRHIEVQILGDKYGNVVHLGERECSLQRRNQKVIEEAPSYFLEKKLPNGHKIRQAMFDQAVKLGQKIGYYSAGTVEFVMNADGEFFFLEMNTRIQVEHPVTESIVVIEGLGAIDLVEWMIRIEEGQALPFAQPHVRFQGHAIETRIYAEDVMNGFMPTSGRILTYMTPNLEGSRGSIRLESGIKRGSDISVYYDPMIAKLCVLGLDRVMATENLLKSLSELVVWGPEIATNIGFLTRLLSSSTFKDCEFSTGFIEQNLKSLTSYSAPDPWQTVVIMATSAQIALNDKAFIASIGFDPKCDEEVQFSIFFKNPAFETGIKGFDFSIVGSILRTSEKAFALKIGGFVFDYEAVKRTNDFHSHIAFELLKSIDDNNDSRVEIPGSRSRTSIAAKFQKTENSGEFLIELDGIEHQVLILERRHREKFEILNKFKKPTKLAANNSVLANIPGLITKVLVKEGDTVKPGVPLFVIESMKMQNYIYAKAPGIVKTVFASVGDRVQTKQELLELEL